MTARRSTGDPALDAMIAREIRYGQTRWTEVWLALITAAYGAVLLVPVPTFTSPSYRIIATFVTEQQAGTIGLCVGLARLAALYLNGNVRETPIIRVIGCIMGALFWSAIALGLAWAVPPLSTGLAVYPVLALAEIHASRRAGGDVFILDSFGFRERIRKRRRDSADGFD